jgi:hypothetical protein
MIAVLLNNKLISCDTIVPLMAELRDRFPDTGVEFLCFEPRTAEVIRANLVLWDAMQGIGPLIQMGRERSGAVHWIFHRIRTVGRVLRYAALAAAGRVAFIHFKALNFWPLRLLAVLAGRRVCYVQSGAVGVGELEQRVSEVMVRRNYSRRLPAVGILVAFEPSWRELNNPRLADRPRCVLPPTIAYGGWIKHVRARADSYFADVFTAASMADSGAVVTYILSSMDENGLLSDPGLFPVLLERTLDALEAAGCRDPVLIKPHPATAPRYMTVIRDAIARHPSLKLATCNLHPAVLAIRSRFAIANCYSTTFSVFHALGVPTVEFTSYRPDILGVTSGGSMRPELVAHFIDSDAGKLAQLLPRLLAHEPNCTPHGIHPAFPHELLVGLGLPTVPSTGGHFAAP